MFGWARFYRNSWRRSYLWAFQKSADKLMKDMPNIDFAMSACGRFYTSPDYIIIRMDHKTGAYMGKRTFINRRLDKMMKYYEDHKYHTIIINLYDDFQNAKIVISADVKNYIDNLKLLKNN